MNMSKLARISRAVATGIPVNASMETVIWRSRDGSVWVYEIDPGDGQLTYIVTTPDGERPAASRDEAMQIARNS